MVHSWFERLGGAAAFKWSQFPSVKRLQKNGVVFNCLFAHITWPDHQYNTPWSKKKPRRMFWAQKIMTFCLCFRVIYNWNFNWRLHPLNERAIWATMLQMIDSDINFHILQKKNLIAGLLLAGTDSPKIHISRHGGHDSRTVTAVTSAGRQDC